MRKASFFTLCIACSLGRVEEQIDIKKEGMYSGGNHSVNESMTFHLGLLIIYPVEFDPHF